MFDFLKQQGTMGGWTVEEADPYEMPWHEGVLIPAGGVTRTTELGTMPRVGGFQGIEEARRRMAEVQAHQRAERASRRRR